MSKHSYERRACKTVSGNKKCHKKPPCVEEMSDFFKVMADKTRLRILMELQHASLCVMHISERVGMSQSAVSHQLAVLRRADLVRADRKGRTLVYSLSDEHVRLVLDMASSHISEGETT